jgi:aminocarboxymuconate-semialdehyde decarboxylase
MIDIFAHIMPKQYVARVAGAEGSRMTRAIIAGTPGLTDLELRFRLLDRFPGMRQVLTLAGPVLDTPGLTARDVARLANDELAELVLKHPDRFVAASAALPMTDPEAMLEECDRAIRDLGMRGVELFTPAPDGLPLDHDRFIPLYEKISSCALPIWIHPRRELTPDYAGEKHSKYRVWGMWGWPYETTVAMTRLVFSGILERFPKLTFIVHHAGAMVPFFEQRIATWYDYVDSCQGGTYKRDLPLPPHTYFQRFYADTAVNGSTPALACAHAFFGTSHLLFGTDMPFDDEQGERSVRETLRSVRELPIPEADKARILAGNAVALLRLP